MTSPDLQTLIDHVQAHFGIRLPVSGSMGSSEIEPIILDIENTNLIAPLEHAVLHYLFLFQDHDWKLRDSEMIEKPDQVLEKVTTVFPDEPAYTHNYYFDITKPWKADSKPLTISGNPWFPDSGLQVYDSDNSDQL